MLHYDVIRLDLIILKYFLLNSLREVGLSFKNCTNIINFSVTASVVISIYNNQ